MKVLYKETLHSNYLHNEVLYVKYENTYLQVEREFVKQIKKSNISLFFWMIEPDITFRLKKRLLYHETSIL